MKAEPYYLINDRVRDNVLHRVRNLPADGKLKIVISNAGDKSAKQRGLQWRWYTEIANAGIGGKHEDTKNGVHLVSKWKWGVPILIRDDEFFAALFGAWRDSHGLDEEAMLWFVDNHVHTEAFNVSQMAEFLTEVQRYYAPMVNLTDPSMYGLIDIKQQGRAQK